MIESDESLSYSKNYCSVLEKIVRLHKDQVALVVPDSTIFGSWVPVTLDTSTINWIINVIKESEINELLGSLNGLRMAYLLACQWAELLIQWEAAMHQTVDLTNLKEAVKTTKKQEINAFSSKIIHSQMKTMLLGNNMHVMTQSLKGVMDPTCLTAWVWWTHTLKWFLGVKEWW